MVNASASQGRGQRFESRREYNSFSLKSPVFVPEAPRVAFSEMGQARIENNLFIYLWVRPILAKVGLQARMDSSKSYVTHGHCS